MNRYVRFAASGFFVALAIGFVALWVRSYYVYDSVWGTSRGGTVFDLGSSWGGVIFAYTNAQDIAPRWNFTSFTEPEAFPFEPEHRGWGLAFAYYPEEHGSTSIVPYWFPVLISASLAALLAFKKSWSFTVRGLLIGTTIVAAALGWAVWAV